MSEIKKIKVKDTTYDIGGSGGGADWGDIGGNINDQTDLKNALDSKGTYSKPTGGIPKTDLASEVQTSLGRADTALQAAPVSSVNGKTGAVNLVPSDLGIGSVFVLKGSKPTYADLPASGNAIGDVWYVVANSVGYIWLNDGTADRWEQLGMEIDLSAYRTSAAQDIIDNGKVDKAQGVAHAGEFLVVGSDGNVTTQSLPLYDGSVV